MGFDEGSSSVESKAKEVQSSEIPENFGGNGAHEAYAGQVKLEVEGKGRWWWSWRSWVQGVNGGEDGEEREWRV